MKYYSGLDVSLKTTSISIINEKGEVIRESAVETDITAIKHYLQPAGEAYAEIGIKSGQLSIPLCKGLRQAGFPVKCVDARHMSAALSARINKNDRNDARGIAQMMRANLYYEAAFSLLVRCKRNCPLKSWG